MDFAQEGDMRIHSRLLALMLLTAGCAAQPAQMQGGTGHSAAESRVTAEVIAATWQRDGDWLVSPILAAPGGATRVGVLLTLAASGDMPDIEARPMRDARPLSGWEPLHQTWGEEDTHVAITDLSELAQGAQLRIPVALIDRLLSLRFDAVIPDAVEPVTAGDEFNAPVVGSGRAALRSELGGLGIVTREAWGARATRCHASDTRKVMMAIHETVTPSTNPARQVRGIQNYHMDTRGWCDVGYHFLVATDGTVYEGRPLNLVGAHVGHHNTGNIGIAHVGCFHSSSCSSFAPNHPPEAMIQATSRLVGELSRLYGISIDTNTVKGHRDHSRASTSCPGDYLEARLPDIRRLAADPSASDGGAPTDPAPSDPAPGDPGPSTPPPADPPPAADPSACGGLSCGSCEATAGCGYCGSTGACQSDSEACTWRGEVESNVCWDALWPCAVASCWNPTLDLPTCGDTGLDEDFSSGRYSVHRYWTTLPAGGPITLRLEATAGGFRPALLLADRGGHIIYGGDAVDLHPDVTVLSASSGRDGSAAQVTLESSHDLAVYVYVTGWGILDGSFSGALSRSDQYHLSSSQDCSTPSGGAGPAPITGGYAGLSQGGSEIPRAGLSNATLRSTLGVSVEPYGEIVMAHGDPWVRGRLSWFGGPNDTGIGPTETGAITGERMRSMNSPVDASRATIDSRPEDFYYVAMRWDYHPNGTSFWRNARILLENPLTGVRVVVRPIDWGPNTSTHRIVDLSPQALTDLGVHTDDELLIAFAAPGTPLGPQ